MWNFGSKFGKERPDNPRFSRWLSVITFGMRKSHKRKTSVAAFSPNGVRRIVAVQRDYCPLEFWMGAELVYRLSIGVDPTAHENAETVSKNRLWQHSLSLNHLSHVFPVKRASQRKFHF
jgi:hypothetical protein